MIPVVAVLGLLYICLLLATAHRLREERAENHRVRRENVRLMILLGEWRAGIRSDQPSNYRPPIGPAQPLRNPFPLETN